MVEYNREEAVAFLATKGVPVEAEETDEKIKELCAVEVDKMQAEQAKDQSGSEDTEENKEENTEEEDNTASGEDTEDTDESSDDTSEEDKTEDPEEDNTPEEEVDEAPVAPEVKGLKYEGKTLAVCHYKGENLIVIDVHGVSYTLSGQVLTDFLATIE